MLLPLHFLHMWFWAEERELHSQRKGTPLVRKTFMYLVSGIKIFTVKWNRSLHTLKAPDTQHYRQWELSIQAFNFYSKSLFKAISWTKTAIVYEELRCWLLGWLFFLLIIPGLFFSSLSTWEWECKIDQKKLQEKWREWEIQGSVGYREEKG